MVEKDEMDLVQRVQATYRELRLRLHEHDVEIDRHRVQILSWIGNRSAAADNAAQSSILELHRLKAERYATHEAIVALKHWTDVQEA